jgi:hypothetical protein
MESDDLYFHILRIISEWCEKDGSLKINKFETKDLVNKLSTEISEVINEEQS